MLALAAQRLCFLCLDSTLHSHGYAALRLATLLMAEDVVIRPACNIEPRPCRQEVETGLRHFHPPFQFQPDNQLLAQFVQEADI